jgi:hypothetical protein
MFSQKFAKKEYSEVFFATDSVDKAMEYLKNYVPKKNVTKWFDTKFA